MQNHSTTVNGKVVVSNYNPAGQVVSSSTATTVRTVDSVSNYTLVQGDKKAPNNFKYDSSFQKYYGGTWDFFTKISSNTYYRATGVKGDFGGNPPISRVSWPRVTSYHYNKALNKLYDKVRGQLDLSIAVAERRETGRLLNAIKQLEDAMKDMPRKGEFFDWRKPLRVLGGRWLQWHLAIRPLIQDVYGAVDEFYRHAVPALMQVQCKSYVKCPSNLPVTKLYSNDPMQVAESSGVQGVMFSIQFKDNGGFDLNRWTSLNPVSLAWELLPLSFVVDYFYNISQMLRSLESSLLTNSLFVDGYWSQLYAFQWTHRETGIRGRTSDSYYIYDAIASGKITSFERSKLSSMPAPRLPTFKLPTSWQQLTTMAALLAVKLKS